MRKRIRAIQTEKSKPAIEEVDVLEAQELAYTKSLKISPTVCYRHLETMIIEQKLQVSVNRYL